MQLLSPLSFHNFRRSNLWSLKPAIRGSYPVEEPQTINQSFKFPRVWITIKANICAKFDSDKIYLGRAEEPHLNPLSAKQSFQLWYPGGQRLKMISFSWSGVKSPSTSSSNTEPIVRRPTSDFEKSVDIGGWTNVFGMNRQENLLWVQSCC